MAEELFKSTPTPKQTEATKQEPANSAEKAAVANKETVAKDAPKEAPKDTENSENVSGVPSLGSNSTASQPAPVLPLAPVVHEEAKQPTVETNLATTNVIADDGTDDQDAEPEEENAPKLDELTMLKQRARMMGIKHSNNITAEVLREKIAEGLTAKAHDTKDENSNVMGEDPEAAALPVGGLKKVKKISLGTHLRNEKMKLVRLRITNLDPKKKDLHGEILTIANEYLGTVRKFVPYGEVTDQGYHVPYCLFEMMRDRKFLSIKSRKNAKGDVTVEQQWVKEFALEVLPQLTTEELARISASQLAHGID